MLCLNAGAIPLVLADPPTNAPAAPPTAAQAADAPAGAPDTPPAPAVTAPPPPPTAGTSPAAKTATAAPAVAPTVDPYEKHFLAEGYKLEMHNGTKLLCRSEEVLGSRLGGLKLCSTLEQLKATETGTRESIERWQRTGAAPTGK
jgi:hypothetical protein